MNWETLMCFGDSITIGARSYLGYPEYAGSFLEKEIENKWNVINYAVSGYTAIELCRYITSGFENLVSQSPGIITVLIGTNDIKNSTSPENFEIAYNQILVKSKLIAMKANVVLIKIPHFPEKVMYPYFFGMNQKVNEFNGIIEKLAAGNKLRVMSFDITENDLFDGVHFNEEGSMNAGRQLAGFILSDKGTKFK
ncbi:MAG: SGNH/GDSL hydrolase family protein [Ignavibacteria bacterium]|nr:SGNH/GDSL hydrolase family protein [Ignavibacteria bacterium]